MSQPKVRTGTAYLSAAQFVFLGSAYAMHIVLGRYLGPVEYGLFGVVLYAATMVRTFSSSGLPIAVSRYVSAQPQNAESVFRRGLQIQLIFAVTISLLFFLTASWIARLLGDETLAPLFRIVAPVIAFFGVFFLTIQYYNGKRNYAAQSLWLAVSYLLRAGLTIGLALIGYRVYGAVIGLVVAIAISCILILVTRKHDIRGEPFPAKTMISFSIPLIIASIAHAFLVDLDMMFVKRLVPGAASAGYYTSAKALANATPLLFYALSSALFPAVSSAYSMGDFDNLKGYIRKANRLLLLVVLPVFVIVNQNSEGILKLVYGTEYLSAAPALRWLILGFCMLAVFLIHKTIITGCGFPNISSIITLMLLPISITLQLIFIPVMGLEGAALAAAFSFGIGVIASTSIVLIKFKAGFPIISTLRIFFAALFILASDLGMNSIGVPLILKIILCGMLYLIILRLTGEISISQLRQIAQQLSGSIKRIGK